MEQPPADAQLVSEHTPPQPHSNNAFFPLLAHFPGVNTPFRLIGYCR